MTKNELPSIDPQNIGRIWSFILIHFILLCVVGMNRISVHPVTQAQFLHGVRRGLFYKLK